MMPLKWFREQTLLSIGEFIIWLGLKCMPNGHYHTRVWARHIDAAVTELEPYLGK